MQKSIRVLIADDQRLFADNLKSVLEVRADDIEVCGVAVDGAEAIRMARQTRPDIILMDVCMPNLDGVLAVQVLKRELPTIKIVMLTTFDDDDYVLDALKYGAIGYLLKDISMAELISTIRSISEGTVVISPAIAGNLVRNFGRGKEAESAGEQLPEWFFQLNKREKQILRYIADGCNNYDIGTRLAIREQTVKNYVSTLYEKMGIHDRLMVMREAERLLPHLEQV
jgi:DNA-binding NarL/FixJ family response regulator